MTDEMTGGSANPPSDIVDEDDRMVGRAPRGVATARRLREWHRTRGGAGRVQGQGMIDGFRATARMWWAPERVRDEGETPDYRYSLANERTFLAWIRTSLALVGGGLAVEQFLTGTRAEVRTAIAVVLLVGGALCAVRAVNHWLRTERAMRRGEDLPLSRFPVLLALGTASAALLVGIGVLLGGIGR